MSLPNWRRRFPVKMRKSERREIRAALLARDPRCRYCKCGLTRETATLDHVRPKSRNGADLRRNLVLACGDCNSRKADRTAGQLLVWSLRVLLTAIVWR